MKHNHNKSMSVVFARSGNHLTRYFICCLLALGMLVAAAPYSASAQDGVNRPETEDTLIDRERFDVNQRKRMLPNDQNERLTTARAQLKRGDFEGAAALLELIYREYPDDPRVITLLTDSYIKLKRFYSATEVLKRQKLSYPLDMRPLISLADVYFKSGKTDSALQEIDFALGIPSDSAEFMRSRGPLKQALNLLLENWQDSLALEYGYWLRERVSDSALFGNLIADALQRRKDYAGAIRECFVQIRQDTTTIGAHRRGADRKLAQLVNYPDAVTEVEEALREFSQESPSDTLVLKYLGEFYVRNQRFDPAFDLFVRYDSLAGGRGGKLFYYVRECFDRGLYAQARRMAEFVIDEHPSSPVTPGLRFFLGRIRWEQEDYRGALAVFQDIAATDPSRSARGEATYLIGDLYLRALNQPDSARSMFEKTLTEIGAGVVAFQARIGLYELEVIDGDLAAAKRRLHQINSSSLLDDQAERALYANARLALYERNLDSANVALKRVVERYPRGLYVNDALSSLMVLQQGSEGDQKLLELYCDAQRYLDRRLSDSLVGTLLEIAEHEDTSLADVAFLDLGKFALSERDTAQALLYLNDVNERYPKSYFAPHAEKLRADIYFNTEGRQPQALAMYRALLKNHGGYPFASNIRAILQEAEGGESGDESGKKKKATSDA